MKPTRLVLFDIDGTILTTLRQAWENPFRDAMEQVFTSQGDARKLDMSRYKPGGKTDTQIIYETLSQNGFEEDRIKQFLPLIRTHYLRLLKQVVEANPSYVALK